MPTIRKISMVGAVFGLWFGLFSPAETGSPSAAAVQEKEELLRIEQTIRAAIGWARNKDLPLLYATVANDPSFLEVHPEGDVVRGFAEFKRGERIWMSPDFKAVRFEIRDLRIKRSKAGDAAWFFCILDDINEWKGRPANWENTRWTGVLEKRDGRWVLVQQHFSSGPEPAPAQPDGAAYPLLFYSGRNDNQEVFLLPPGEKTPRNLTNHPARDFCPAASPDGKTVLFLSDREGNPDIYSMSSDGSGIRRLTATPEPEDHPEFTPDGTRILFVRDFEQRTEIWIMNADGSDPRRLTHNQARDERPFLSPDGSKIVFMSNRDGNYEIYTMAPDGSRQTRLTDTPEWEIFPVWSPDGAKIAYASKYRSGGRMEGMVRVMNADGSGDYAVTAAETRDENPMWSGDGRHLVLQSVRDGNFEVYQVELDGSRPVRLTDHPAWDGWASYLPAGPPAPRERPPSVLVLLGEWFGDAYFPLREEIERRGWTVRLAGLDGEFRGCYNKERDVVLQRDVAIQEKVDFSGYDALIIQSGPQWRKFRENPAVLAFVKNAHAAGLLVASFCTGNLTVRDAGLVDLPEGPELFPGRVTLVAPRVLIGPRGGGPAPGDGFESAPIKDLCDAVARELAGKSSALRQADSERLVDIGSRRLQIHQVGKGGPAVVMETGLGDELEKMKPLQARLSRTVQVITYNRAGYGRSDPGPLPRDCGREAEDLKALLSAASIPGPFVLVGHSLGALVVQAFASKYPAAVAGMILLDPPPLSFVQGRDWPEYRKMAEGMTAEWQAAADSLAGSKEPREKVQSAFLRTIASEHREMFGETARLIAAITDFGDKPLWVITSGKPNPAFGEAAGRFQKYWADQSRALAAKSTRGRAILAEDSAHYLYLEAPELVTETILSAVDAARAP